MIKQLNKEAKKFLNKDHIWFPEPGEMVHVIVDRSSHKGIKTPKLKTGTIDSVDGQYITVKLDGKAILAEYYAYELKLMTNTNEGISKKG